MTSQQQRTLTMNYLNMKKSTKDLENGLKRQKRKKRKEMEKIKMQIINSNNSLNSKKIIIKVKYLTNISALQLTKISPTIKRIFNLSKRNFP